MRLIIKDYLLQLKEKEELDLLLCDLLLQQGYNTDNVPRTGNRQYGVDIQAHREEELLLCVVKQGNIDRKIWDDGPNAIRQSMNEIFDVYLPMLPAADWEKQIRIAVVTNGMLEEAVKPNWNGYVNGHRQWQGKPIAIEFWGIDEITDRVQKDLFDEHLFTPAMQAALRKALYFVEEPDYKNIFFEQIIDHYIARFEELQGQGLPAGRTKKRFQKEAASLFLAAQMVCQYAANVGRYKLSVMVSEYLLMRYWKFLLDRNLFEKEGYASWLTPFCRAYEKWSGRYYEAVRECCETEGGFPHYNNIVEQRLMLYEVVGFLTAYAFYERQAEEGRADQGQADLVLNTIILLINHYPQFFYPPYDSHIGPITMLYRLLLSCGRREDVLTLLRKQTATLERYYCDFHKYPTPADSFRDAIDIELGNDHEDYEVSGMWGYFLLWIAALDQREIYEDLKPFLDQELGQVTKCAWFIRENEETAFYDAGAMYRAGEGIALGTEKNYEAFREKTRFILGQYEAEHFSYEKYSFPALEIIVCRYYGYAARVILPERESGKGSVT